MCEDWWDINYRLVYRLEGFGNRPMGRVLSYNGECVRRQARSKLAGKEPCHTCTGCLAWLCICAQASSDCRAWAEVTMKYVLLLVVVYKPPQLGHSKSIISFSSHPIPARM